MSIASIREAIRAVGDAEAERIEQAAAAEAEQIIAQAEAEAAARFAAKRRAALTSLPAERVRGEQRARLEAARIVNAARAALVEEALHAAQEQLAALRQQAGYPEVLRALLTEAVEALRAENGIVQVLADERDRETLLPLLDSVDLRYQAAVFDRTCWGGVAVKEEDSRIYVDNTLERRFERATPHLYPLLSGILFDNA